MQAANVTIRSVLMSKKVSRLSLWFLVATVALSLGSSVSIGATCASKARQHIQIILDVGHTATETDERYRGATSARGEREFYFNLSLARRIKQELLRAGFRSTLLMVTQTNGSRGLRERTDRANDLGADVFLSIHHDAVRKEYLQSWRYQDKEYFFYDQASGFSLHVSPKNEQFDESLRLAKLLADQLIGQGLHFNTIHSADNPVGARRPFLDSSRGIYDRGDLWVVSKAKMPAVLLESGSIVNRDEELVVKSERHQGAVAEAIVDAISKFCAEHEAR